MKKLEFEQLEKLSSADTGALLASGQHFTVIANRTTGDRIRRFLENEALFRLSPKKFRDRIRYLRGAGPAFFILGFAEVWVKSMLKGYKVEAVDAGPVFDILFLAPNGVSECEWTS